jgi:hypothetical protein
MNLPTLQTTDWPPQIKKCDHFTAISVVINNTQDQQATNIAHKGTKKATIRPIMANLQGVYFSVSFPPKRALIFHTLLDANL